MIEPARTYQELLEDNILLIQKIKELEQSESERKQTEAALRASEDRFTYLTESAPEAILVHSGGRFIYLNPSMLRLLGASDRDELLGHDIMERIAPEYHDSVRERIRSQRETFQPVPPMEQEYLRMDGSRVSVETTAVSIHFKGEDAQIVFVHDITEHKLMEEKSHNMLNFLQTLFNTIPSPIFCKDINGLYQDFNKEFEDYTGKSRKEIIGKSVYDLYPRDVADKYNEMDLALFSHPGRQIYEQPIIYADGNKHDVVVNKATYLNADGALAGLVGVMVDITERKKTEEALRIAVMELQQYHDQLEDLVAKRTAELNRAFSILAEREARFRSYFDLPLHGIAITSPEKGWLEVNDRICSITGYPRNEIVSMTWSEMTHPGDLVTEVEHFNRVLSGQIEQYTMDKRFIRKDGMVVWTSLAVGCVRKPDGTVDYIIALVEDITDRKRAEEALQESEANYRRLFDSAPAGIYQVDFRTGKFLKANDIVCGFLGCTQEEVSLYSPWDVLTDESKQLLLERLGKMNSGEEITDSPIYEVIVKDGRRLWLQLSSKNIYDSEGVVGADVVAHDITERKKAEKELQKQEMHLSTIIESTADGILAIDSAGRVIKANQRFADLWKIEPDLLKKGNDEALLAYIIGQLVDPEAFLKKVRELYVSNAVDFDVILFKDGKIIERYSCPLLNEGVVNGRVWSFRDVTERKKAEDNLKETLQNLRKSFGATVQVLVSVVEGKDPYTSGHQARSADLARAIAKEMGLPQDRIEGIRMAGSIHDIGKMSVPAEILVKPIKLSELEFSLIKEHAQKGYEMLKDVESPWPLAQIVYQHHERMDGSGYPRNMKGEEILIEARILAVADVVEAMASHRPYRPAIGLNAALAEIENNKGTIYDADAVDACLRLFRKKGFQLEVK